MVLAFEAPAQHEHRHRGRHREHREPGLQREQETEDGDDRDAENDEEDGAERGEAPDRGEVGLRARQKLSRLPLVVEPDVESLQVLVQVVAHLGLDAQRDGCKRAPPPERESDLDAPEHNGQQEQRDEATRVTVRDRAVDRRLDDQRHREGARDRDHRRERDEDDLGDVGPQIRADAQQRTVAHDEPPEATKA